MRRNTSVLYKHLLSFFNKHSLTRPSFLLVIFILGFIVRIILAHIGFHDDIIVQTEWGKTIAQRGYDGLYNWGIWIREWPNHPPLVTIIYGYLTYRMVALKTTKKSVSKL